VAQLLLDKAVLPEAPSYWQPQRDVKSGPTYELSAAEPAFKMPERVATELPAWSQQVLNAPIYELPASPDPVELPAGNLNTALRSPTSITQRITLLSHQKRARGT